jgi:hypothetical protein
MSNYTQTTNFATKDALASGNPLKIVKGTEINTEFANIATAVATKSDTASPTFTGTVTIPTLSVSGTSTLTGVSTLTAQPIVSSLTASKPVFTDASKGLVSTGTLGADQGGTGVANNAAMTVTGSGNFAYTRTLTGVTNVTLPTTGTLATLAGTETFTNKTLTSPTIGGTPTGVGVLTSGTAVASTSGTSIDFTSIPSWVKRITVMFQGVSTSGTSIRLLRIGSGSIETTGYLASAVDLFNTGSVVGLASTTYYPLVGNGSNTATAAVILDGAMQLTLLGSNIWNLTGTLSGSGSGIGAGTVQFAGTKTTSGALDRLRISTLNGTDTFDAGSVNILYE